MKKSKKVNLIASLVYVAVAVVLILLVEPCLGWMVGPVPGITFVVMAAALACPIACYIIIPRVEKMEEEEGGADK